MYMYIHSFNCIINLTCIHICEYHVIVSNSFIYNNNSLSLLMYSAEAIIMLIFLSLIKVYKVLYPYTPRKEDELELIEDDFVFVSIADQGQTG